MPETCILRIIRRGRFADRYRSYKIFANGMQVGTVARNSTLDVEVPSGRLTVEGRIDWARSRPLVIDALPKQRIDLEISNNWSPFLWLWAGTLGAGSYLTLKRLSPNPEAAPAGDGAGIS